MPIFLVPRQLTLWPLERRALDPLPPDWIDDGRDDRTERQWLESIRDYCLWRAGSSWRQITRRSQRENADRWWYLNGARTVTDLLAGPDVAKTLKPALPVLNPAPSPDDREQQFDERNRRWLVSELMRWNPALTDRVILSHLSHEKLVRMLLAAMDAATVACAQERRSA